MITLLYGRADQDLRGEVLRRMGKSGAKKRLLLVPERFSHVMERALCKTLGNAGARGCEVLSFSRLASRVADVEGGGAVPLLDAGGRMMVLYGAMRKADEALDGARRSMRKPAFLSSMMATIEECRQCRVPPEQLNAAAEQLPDIQKKKVQEIARIYGVYRTLISDGRTDPQSRMDKLAEDLRCSDWAEGQEIWVWGFSRFTAQEVEVLRLLQVRAAVTVAMTTDESAREDIFAAALRFLKALERAGVRVKKEAVERPRALRESLKHLERNLFADRAVPFEGPCDVVRVEAPTPRLELEWAASEIRRLVESGYRFRDIALCARDFAPYEGLVESVLGRYEVPVYLSERADVLQKPILALVTSALAAAAGNYPYEEMFRYLKTGLAGLTEEERDLLENYVLTWNIRGGTWSREKDWDMHPEGYGHTFSDEDAALVKRLDGIRRRVIAPLETLRRVSKGSGREHALTLYRVMGDIGLAESIEQRAATLEADGQSKTAAEYRQLWEILLNVLEQCAKLLGDMELTAEEFSRVFSLALGQYDVGTIPVSLDQVTAGDANRMAGKEVKILFLLGADSRSIPGSAQEPGLFSPQDRSALAQQDVTLSFSKEEQLAWEMTVLYETCTLPMEKLYVSYALTDGAGEARTPSFLFQRLAALFPEGEAVRADGSCRLAAPVPALELARERADVAQALLALPEYAPKVQRVLGASQWRRGRLSPQGVFTLYGGTVPMSATRLDLYNSCHFSHFMKFGLEAKPRQKARFRPSDYGTFIHAVLEEVLGEALKQPDGIKALAEDKETLLALTRNAADRYEREELGGLDEETARFRHTFQRMKQSACAVAESVVAELAASDFSPDYFELGFGRGQTLPALEVERGVRLRLTGFVDRVDSWVKGDKRYLRVVDYKTGKKSFDFSDVADGRGLQMLLYLFALRREGQGLFGSEELVPAGVLYVPARNPVVNGDRSMTEEEIAAERRKELRRKGLVLDEAEVLDAMEHTDGAYQYLPIASTGAGKRDYLVSAEQMDVLDEYLTHALEGVADQLAQGNVDADPYWHDGDKNACRWCDYAAACQFEECCGDKARLRKALSAAEFWSHLTREEEDDHGL